MKKFINIISILLIIFMMGGMLAGCRKTNETDESTTKEVETTTTKETTTETQQTTTEQPELPLTTEDITLTYWVSLPANASKIINDFSENEVYKEMEKRTGIKIEFIHPVLAQIDEQFNLMIAAGDYPDLIGSAAKFKGGGETAIAQKVYLDLTDFADEYAPNYQNLRKSNPEIAKQTVTDNGTMWCFYQIMTLPHRIVQVESEDLQLV